MQPTGIRSYKETISFALDYRDDESPFFMALSAVRKIYFEAINELGYTGRRITSYVGPSLEGRADSFR
jgi:hypothetical protein